MGKEISPARHSYYQEDVMTARDHQGGRIVPLLGFTAVTDSCVDKPHTHHAYYRFDFDINGAGGDHIRQRRMFLFIPIWSKQDVERSRNRASNRRWRVADSSGSAYEIGTRATPAVRRVARTATRSTSIRS